MSNEPIPDEFGSWARLLPTPEEKPAAVERSTDHSASVAKAEEPVLESGPDETATLAIASEAVDPDDEPLFASAMFQETADSEPPRREPVVRAIESTPEQKIESTPAPMIAEPKIAEPATVEKSAEPKLADLVAEPNIAKQKLAEPKLAEEPASIKQAAEAKPVNDKAAAHPAIDDKVKRPFRVKLRGSLLVLVRLPNKRTIQGSFHQLSTSGGVIHFEKPLDEKLEVELIFHLKETTIRSKGQMLFPMWATQGWMQPFRFVGLAEDNRRVLDEGLKSFVGDLAKGSSAGA